MSSFQVLEAMGLNTAILPVEYIDSLSVSTYNSIKRPTEPVTSGEGFAEVASLQFGLPLVGL